MKEPSKNKSADTDWEIDIQSCSATDCTGLIPALPESDAELEHYQDLYHYLPDEKKGVRLSRTISAKYAFTSASYGIFRLDIFALWCRNHFFYSSVHPETSLDAPETCKPNMIK